MIYPNLIEFENELKEASIDELLSLVMILKSECRKRGASHAFMLEVQR